MKNFKKILILKDEIEAGLMGSILEERKIPHFIKSYHDSALNGMFQFQKGWGYLEAPEGYADEIKNIHNDMVDREQDE